MGKLSTEGSLWLGPLNLDVQSSYSPGGLGQRFIKSTSEMKFSKAKYRVDEECIFCDISYRNQLK